MATVSTVLLALFGACRDSDDGPGRPTAGASSTPEPGAAPTALETAEEAVPEPPQSRVVFRWSFYVDEDRQRSIEDRITLPGGTRLRMMLELLEESTHAYVFHRSPVGEIQVLFPGAGSQAAPGIHDLLPHGSALDQSTGLERFHLIVSPFPITTLDDALAAADLEALGSALGEVRGQYESLEVTARKPARIGGSIRSAGPPTTEFEHHGVFCRTFTIDHR